VAAGRASVTEIPVAVPPPELLSETVKPTGSPLSTLVASALLLIVR
jgi:hypothetical protein